MRRTLFAVVCLLSPAPLLAAPVPAGQSPAARPITEAHLQAAASGYQQHLSQILDTIEATYVRPVHRADLVEAALAGLYEAAGVPVPDTLKTDIKKATTPGAFDQLAIRTRVSLGIVEGLHGRKALIASCRAMMRSLDPFCTVVTGEEAATATGFDQNFGLGIDLVEKAGPGPLVIKAVVPGGPAQRAGLQGGDQIILVNDKETRTLSPEQALRLLNGAQAVAGADILPPPPGLSGSAVTTPTPVHLAVRSAGAREERKVTLVRDFFEPETVQGVTRRDDNSWDYWIDRKKHIAHVRIVTLARHTADELERVLTRLDGDDGLRGLILDLRWCPGGYLTSATGAAGLFLEGGIIARTTGRTEREMVYQAQGSAARKFLHFPVVVLVNGDTTGGGELIAAALQDHKRAVVAGQRTRGKGSIQTPLPLSLQTEGGRFEMLELKLTNGTFLRPSGKSLNRFADSKPTDDWGVRPDPKLETRVSPELSRRLKEWWREQSLRPGASNKALPLDDPEEDPQRQAALKALLRIVVEKK